MNVLALAAHPDDFEIGCFGTLALHIMNGDTVFGLILTGGECGGDAEKRRQESVDACGLIHINVYFASFPDGKLKDDIDTITFIDNFIKEHKIDVMYSPSIHERHQDHRNLGYAMATASRFVKEAYYFETTSSDGFSPQLFVDISKTIDLKNDAIKKHITQDNKCYMDPTQLEMIAQGRGFKLGKSNIPFEAFEVVKIMR